jgi:hypothetical protein
MNYHNSDLNILIVTHQSGCLNIIEPIKQNLGVANTNISMNDLAKKIMMAIENDFYKKLESNVISNASPEKLNEFGNIILSTYQNVIK